MSKVLLFNIHGEKRMKILFLLIRLGIACREVSPAEQGSIRENEDGTLLDGLRRNNTPVALKAVVTEQNLSWTAAALHDALLEEHRRLSQSKT